MVKDIKSILEHVETNEVDYEKVLALDPWTNPTVATVNQYYFNCIKTSVFQMSVLSLSTLLTAPLTTTHIS